MINENCTRLFVAMNLIKQMLLSNVLWCIYNIIITTSVIFAQLQDNKNVRHNIIIYRGADNYIIYVFRRKRRRRRRARANNARQ